MYIYIQYIISHVILCCSSSVFQSLNRSISFLHIPLRANKYVGIKTCFPLRHREKNIQVTWRSIRLAMAMLMYRFLLCSKKKFKSHRLSMVMILLLLNIIATSISEKFGNFLCAKMWGGSRLSALGCYGVCCLNQEEHQNTS